MRTAKTVNGVIHSYIYASGKLMRETYGTNTLDFFYDASGAPYAIKYNDDVYYYITNLQGDILHIVDDDGDAVVSYEYGPYGQLIRTTGDMADSLGAANPLRYRGYYYDAELEMYYLQSRYYDPAMGRFINADAYASTGQGILGSNMFAYCRNNPPKRCDISGSTDEDSSELGLNTENMMALFGVDSPDDLPDLPENCMVFIENITSITIGHITVISGTTIVINNDKYCIYSFQGIGFGASGIPYDKSITVGYVYNVEDVDDYCGAFFGGSFNMIGDVKGGAFATNGVYAKIITGASYLSASLGYSITSYSTPYSDWKYGKANINFITLPTKSTLDQFHSRDKNYTV